MHDLLKIVTNLGSPRVLVAGDFMLDIYVYGDALRISPEAPVPVLKVTETNYRCGGAGSVAADIIGLGGIPMCLGYTGADANGKKVTEILSKAGADTTCLFTLKDRPTITKQRLIGLAQHRHKQQLMRVDEELSEPYTDEQYKKILRVYKENLKKADIVCIQDYNKGLLPDYVCREMIDTAKSANKKVLVDPCLSADYSKYTGATLITPNRKESGTATGFEVRTREDAARAAEQLYKKLKLDAAVITLDKEGAYLKTKGIDEIIPTRPRNVYDVTGAGDMVLATLAVSLSRGCDYKTAVRLSNITGGLEVEKFGAVPVTIEEIINEVTGGKLLSQKSLLENIERRKSQKETVVFTNGCFDVLHRGHIEFLKFCKSQGNVVVLGLNSDSSVKKIKGPDRPINNQNDRAAVLGAMETVDYITIFDESTPLNLIKKIKPDVLVKGQDWAEKGVVGREFVEAYGGKVVLAPLVEGKSSTATINKMKALENKS